MYGRPKKPDLLKVFDDFVFKNDYPGLKSPQQMVEEMEENARILRNLTVSQWHIDQAKKRRKLAEN